jgi:hypothetical protein
LRFDANSELLAGRRLQSNQRFPTCFFRRCHSNQQYMGKRSAKKAPPKKKRAAVATQFNCKREKKKKKIEKIEKILIIFFFVFVLNRSVLQSQRRHRSENVRKPQRLFKFPIKISKISNLNVDIYMYIFSILFCKVIERHARAKSSAATAQPPLNADAKVTTNRKCVHMFLFSYRIVC